MAGNDSIQILRGTASNIAASTETLLDGQLLYDKTNNKLFIGNGEQPVNSATQIGGMEGLSIYRSNQILMTTASSYINKNTIAVPDGRTIQNGDLIIANSTYSYLYTVIDNRPNYASVKVDYLQSLRGASGSSGTGSDGKGVFYSNVAAVDGTVQIRRSTLNQPSGFTAGVGDIILANSRLFYINASSGTGSASVFGVNMIANLIGATGTTPNISVSASVSNTTGTPSVQVTKSGTDENPSFAFAFSGLKGENADVPELYEHSLCLQFSNSDIFIRVLDSSPDETLFGSKLAVVNYLLSNDYTSKIYPLYCFGRVGSISNPNYVYGIYTSGGELYAAIIDTTGTGTSSELLTGTLARAYMVRKIL